MATILFASLLARSAEAARISGNENEARSEPAALVKGQEKDQIIDEQDELYDRQKRMPASEYPSYIEHLQQLLRKQESAFGKDSPQVSCTLDQLYSVYHMQRRPDLQIDVARRSMEIKRRILGTQAVDTAFVTCHLASSLAACGRYEEALSALQNLLSQLKPTSGTRSAETMLTFEIAQTYFQWNKFAEAQPWFDKAVGLKLQYAPNSRVYPTAYKVQTRQRINQRLVNRYQNRLWTNANKSRS